MWLMKKFGQKNTFSSVIFSKFTLILLIIVALYFATSVYERYRVERDMADRRASVEMQYEDLEARKAALTDRVDYLKGDSGIESEIRKNFDVAKEGEQVVIIVDDEPGQEVVFSEGIEPTVAPDKPWWRFW